MNKYQIFIIITLMMVIMMLVGDAISMAYIGGIPDSILIDEEVRAITVFGMFGIYWKMLTFSLVGVPVWFNLIAVYVPTLTLAFMFLSWVRGVE